MKRQAQLSKQAVTRPSVRGGKTNLIIKRTRAMLANIASLFSGGDVRLTEGRIIWIELGESELPPRPNSLRYKSFYRGCAIRAVNAPALRTVSEFGDSKRVRSSTCKPTRPKMSMAAITVFRPDRQFEAFR